MDISCHFNETGVKLYQEGRGSEAFDLFHASIEVQLLAQGRMAASLNPVQCQSPEFLNTIAQAFKNDFYERPNPTQQFLSPTCLSHEVVSSAPVNQIMYLQDSSSPGPPFNHRPSWIDDPYVFDKMFSWKAPVCPDQDQYVVSVAMDLYNMALILQKGLMNHKMKHCLERALLLYSYAGELLWKNLGMALMRPCRLGATPLSTVYCAVLNNTGYLLHQMGRFDWSQDFFFRLNKALEMSGPVESASEQKDRDNFQLNVIALYGTWAAAASA